LLWSVKETLYYRRKEMRKCESSTMCAGRIRR
jgi:hypothetical protein